MPCLAFDYGEVRIGVACGNSLLKIPHPLGIINALGLGNKICQIKPLIVKWQPKLLVVGLPNTSDSPAKIQLINTIKNFAKKLELEFKLPVCLVNEDFTSIHAEALLKEQAIYGRKQKNYLDSLAACSILEIYFSQQH